MSKINYDFRANTMASWWHRHKREVMRKSHLDQLKPEFPNLFKDIDVEQLKCDAEAVNILTASCETISIILDAKNKSDKPVYAGLGERHKYPAHRLHHMLVVKDLSNRDFRLSVGQEFAEGRYCKAFLAAVEDKLGQNYCEKMARIYFDGHDLALETRLRYSSKSSPYSSLMLNKLLSHYNMSDDVTVKFTDAERSLDGQALYDDDFKVKKYANGKTGISLTSADGMRIRNQVSVENMPEGDVMVQISGKNHIDDTHPDPDRRARLNADTVITFAKDAGFEPVGRVLTSFAAPLMNAELYSDTVFENQEYLSRAESFSNVSFGYMHGPKVRELVDDGREIAYVNAKMDVLGMGDVCDIDLLEFKVSASEAFDRHVGAACDIIRTKRDGQAVDGFNM